VPQLCSPAQLASIRRLSPAGLRDQLATAVPPTIIDVREPREFAGGHLPGALNIPVAQIATRLHELPATTPVFICRSGARSLIAAQLAARAGIASPQHLEGGLLAWAREVDPTLQVAAVG
jgi:rhodanese-related sulfurtransferase